MQKHLRLVLISLALITLQTTVITFMSVLHIVPDVMLIWIVYIAVTQGQIPATLYGFCIGLALDLISGQFLGLTAFTKTLAGFLAGYFYNENKIEFTLSNYRFLVIVGSTALVHNVVYFVLFTRGSDVGLFTAIVQFGVFSMLYTTALSAIPMFAAMRKGQLR